MWPIRLIHTHPLPLPRLAFLPGSLPTLLLLLLRGIRHARGTRYRTPRPRITRRDDEGTGIAERVMVIVHPAFPCFLVVDREIRKITSETS